MKLPQFAIAMRGYPSEERGPLLEVEIDQAEQIDLDVYDVIGDFWGEGVSAKDVAKKLREAKKANQINVRINSTGGDAYDGGAIYTLLAQSPANVTVDIDGVAASAASVIAMAGNQVRMSETALLMIHNPWTYVVGEAADLRQRADMLDKLRDSLANAYIRKTGLTREKITELLDAETWMSADEAVDLGFADHVTEAVAAAAALPSELNWPSQVPDKYRALYDANLKRAAMAVPGNRIATTVTLRFDPESMAELENHTARIERAAASADQPAKPGPDQHKTKDGTMTALNPTILSALGLLSGSTEQDVISACARLRELEVTVLTATGASSTAAAAGAVKALKEKADRADDLATKLAKVEGERDGQRFASLIASGKGENKLTVAEAAFWQESFAKASEAGRGSDKVDELEGYLKCSSRRIPERQHQGNRARTGTTVPTEALTHNGKTYADMSFRDRATLKTEQPELWEAMKSEFEASRTGRRAS